MNTFFSARFQIFCLALLALLIVGCGKKGPVRPLAKPLPAAPSEIHLEQLGEGFLLSWSVPRSNLDGSLLKDLEGFKIYKMSYDPANDCPECRDTSLEWRRVDLEFLAAAFRSDDRLWIWDEDIEPEKGYQYRVTPYTSRNQIGQPAVVRRPYLPSPPPPGELSAEALDRLVRLHWQPSEQSFPEGEWLGFKVYRRQMGVSSRFRPIHSSFLPETRYEDFELKNDLSFEYGVRSAVRLQGLVVESPLSPVVSAKPERGK